MTERWFCVIYVLVRLGGAAGSAAAADREALSAIVSRVPLGFESSDLSMARTLLQGGH